MFVTFHLVVFAWIFFRAENVQDAFLIINNIFHASTTARARANAPGRCRPCAAMKRISVCFRLHAERVAKAMIGIDQYDLLYVVADGERYLCALLAVPIR